MTGPRIQSLPNPRHLEEVVREYALAFDEFVAARVRVCEALQRMQKAFNPALLTRRPTAPRANEVLDMLVAGKSRKEIAQALNISVRTVAFHVSEVLHHYGVHNRTDLMLALQAESTENQDPGI